MTRSAWTIALLLLLCLLAPRTGGATESKVVERCAYAEHGEAPDAETGAPGGLRDGLRHASARQQILDWEVENATRLRESGHLSNESTHVRP
jgi:hypothetical protein